ncbi:hypothetical protein CC80DRAFT_531085 [Byssothecium circinans]|uniref:Uncharacterized protein n=1 Tax=Byssothecium circinans TaxID=147558 RepID=A0A6A5UBH9_9PLEO|nr:hypothetical protein CC80DRAFT_531085 [Byssothecium circinans]
MASTPKQSPNEGHKAADLATSAPADDTRILYAVNRCLELVDTNTSASDTGAATLVASLKQRLSIWSKYAGVTSRPGLRLDDRLRDHEDVQMAIVGLLGAITSNLEKVIRSPQGPLASSASSGVDAISGGRGETNARMKRASRRDGRRTRAPHGRPLIYQWICYWTWWPDDAYFCELAKLLVRRQFPAAQKSLADHLGYSIYLRCKRLLYKQRHEEKLAYSGHLETGGSAPSTESFPKPHAIASMPPIKSAPVRPAVKDEAIKQFQPPSTTQLSKVNPSLLSRRMKTKTEISSQRSGPVPSEEEVRDYPNPPTPSGYGGRCICPYCFEPLPESCLTEKTHRPRPSALHLLVREMLRKHTILRLAHGLSGAYDILSRRRLGAASTYDDVGLRYRSPPGVRK